MSDILNLISNNGSLHNRLDGITCHAIRKICDNLIYTECIYEQCLEDFNHTSALFKDEENDREPRENEMPEDLLRRVFFIEFRDFFGMKEKETIVEEQAIFEFACQYLEDQGFEVI